MRRKLSAALRFLAALIAVVAGAVLLVMRVTGDEPEPPSEPPEAPEAARRAAPPAAAGDCDAPRFQAAAQANTVGLHALAFAPFKRPETGWATYAPLIAKEIATACPPQSSGFARAYAAWEGRQDLPADGVVDPDSFARMVNVMHLRRPIVREMAQGCPPPPDPARLEETAPAERYGGKTVALRRDALAAYRRMRAAAFAEAPQIARDPRNLTIFSGYRDPPADAERCLADQNCDGIVRAVCSPHRTGLALDLYVGEAPGHRPDSSADPNRLFMSQTLIYRWLVANAHRFGFVPYPFEPWHWEWAGAPVRPEPSAPADQLGTSRSSSREAARS